MVKLIILFCLLGIASVVSANKQIIVNQNVVCSGGMATYSQVYVCTLEPFNKIFADVGLTQADARHKVKQRCNRQMGKDSIFCEASKASCVISSLGEGPAESLFVIYEGPYQSGASLVVNSDIPDLSVYNFANRISSFSVPIGWTVQFFEGANYTGSYYTRKGGKQQATGFEGRIGSIRILNR